VLTIKPKNNNECSAERLNLIILGFSLITVCVESELKSFPEALKGSELFPNSFSFLLSIR